MIRKHGRDWRKVTLAVAFGAFLAIAMLLAADYLINAGKIHQGVEVGGVALGGKTSAQAHKLLKERTTGGLKEFEFTGPEKFTFTAEQMGINFDVAKTVQRAYSVGRRGNVLERLVERARATLGGLSVPTEADYLPGAPLQRVEDIAIRMNVEVREASGAIDGSEVAVIPSREGYRVDVAATMNNVDEAVEDMTGEVEIVGETLEPEITTQEAEAAAEKAREAMGGQLVLNAEGEQWTLSPADVGSALNVKPKDGGIQVSLNRDLMKDRLVNVYAALTVEPVEAGYEINGNQISVTESQTGKSIEDQKLLNAIESGIFEGKREYQVPVVTAEPELTTARAKELKPTALLGTYRTNYAIVPDDGTRAANLAIASDAITNTQLAPGEIFSMNEAVSHLDYYETKVIVEGQETKAAGGGLCQVTSTLYMAANFAGLDVLERHPHYAQLPYIRPGLDATIWFGSLDMKFKNTTKGYLLLREYVADDGYIYAEIYGRPSGTEVTMWSEPSYMGATYSQWVTYQRVHKDGQVLYDEVLHHDTYQPLVDEHGRTVPPPEVPVAPVSP